MSLLASLSLAKLHQATGRPNDAYAVLAPALEGFAPTAEMPEIAGRRRKLLAAFATMARQERVCATIGRSNLNRPLQSSATQTKRRRET